MNTPVSYPNLTLPNVLPAGKLIPPGDTAKACLRQAERPPTPPVIRKYRNSFKGKADVPEVASTLVHGITSKTSFSAGALINPQTKTSFQRRLQEVGETVYTSCKKGGRCRDQDVNPPWSSGKTFGVKTVRDSGVREFMNPSKTAEELELEGQGGHVRIHNGYFVGKQIDRKYNWGPNSKDSRFGIHTPHFNDGRSADKSLRWLDETQEFPNPKTGWTRSGSREKMASPLGKTNNVKGKTLNLPPDHAFGIILPPDEFGVGGIIHSAEPGENVRSREQHRSLVSAVQNHLKKVNLLSFPSLLEAFRHYDKKGQGMIDREDLQAACRHFQLDVSEPVLDDLLDYCDTDKDGRIDFLEFANFLNWKDKMPIRRPEQLIMTNESRTSSAPANFERTPSSEPARLPASQALITPEDLESIKPGSSLKTVRTLRRPKADPHHFMTSSSLIGASRDGQLASSSRAFGIPSVRSDLPAPRLKRVSDTNNYGDASTAAGLLHPSLPALHGVHEQHFLCPRTKEELAEIFRNVCTDISEETFEEAWKLASMKHPAGDVCVEAFRNALREIKAM